MNPQPAEGRRPAESGRSILILVFTFREETKGRPGWLDRFEKRVHASRLWRRANPDSAGLLPHLDSIEHGGVFRAFRADGALPNFFPPGFAWTLCDLNGKGQPRERPTVEVLIPRAPRLFAFESGYIFVCLEVLPRSGSLEAYLDLAGHTVRGRLVHLAPERVPSKAAGWRTLREERFGTPEGEARRRAWAVRSWIGALLPGTPMEPPPGARWNPAGYGLVLRDGPLSPDERARVRLLLRSDATVSPDPDGSDCDRHTWRVADGDTGLACAYGFTRLDESGAIAAFERRLESVRTKYLFKWLLVEHQRLVLLDLSTRCARLAETLDPESFDELRVELLRYSARFNFSRISEAPRQEAFYEFLRRALDVEDLFLEVKEEITETSDHLQTKRSERLNVILATLTFVAAPLGIVIGVFQRETLPPAPFDAAAILNHRPAQIVALVAAGGALMALFLAPPSSLRRTLHWLGSKLSRLWPKGNSGEAAGDREGSD